MELSEKFLYGFTEYFFNVLSFGLVCQKGSRIFRKFSKNSFIIGRKNDYMYLDRLVVEHLVKIRVYHIW